MNTLVNAIVNEDNITQTTNGDKAYKSTLSACLDFFYKAAASRGVPQANLFVNAIKENEEIAVRTLLWLRDVREGAGERQQFKDLVKNVINTKYIDNVLKLIPELGRYDDLLVFENTQVESKAFDIIKQALQDGNALCAKWMPRKGKTAKKLAAHCGIKNEALWRKYIVRLSSTVEQQMCAGDWENIDFSKVPSKASAIYQNAFERHAPTQYGEFKEKLKSGETKVNAGALYPYDVLNALRNGDVAVATAQWKALPDFVGDVSFLPIVDVSGSMTEKVTPSISCLDIAISLGLYLCERNKSVFKDVFVTFSSTPQFLKFKEDMDFPTRIFEMALADWGMNTNIVAVYQRLLDMCVTNNVKSEDIPDKLLIVSDMQFDRCVNGAEHIQWFKQRFEEHGYKFPTLVFWTVNAKAGNVPVTQHETGSVLVSGFSPSIMKGVLKGSVNPSDVMLEIVMQDRYNIS